MSSSLHGSLVLPPRRSFNLLVSQALIVSVFDTQYRLVVAHILRSHYALYVALSPLHDSPLCNALKLSLHLLSLAVVIELQSGLQVNSPRWAAYNQLRLEAESAANGLQTLLLTAQVSWSSWMVLPLMLDWSQATNKAYEAEEEAMQTAYGLTAECPVAPSKAAELANAMLTPGMPLVSVYGCCLAESCTNAIHCCVLLL